MLAPESKIKIEDHYNRLTVNQISFVCFDSPCGVSFFVVIGATS